MSEPNRSPENGRRAFGVLIAKISEDPRRLLVSLLVIAVIAGTVGFIIGASHPRYVEEVVVLNMTNVTRTPNTVPNVMYTSRNITILPNVTIPGLENSISMSLYLTNSPSKNEILVTENGTIYFQISGYFNQFPGSNTNSNPYYNYYPRPEGDIFIYYMKITAYNGSLGRSVVLPVFTSVDYNNQTYFVYRAYGNLPQLQELLGILKPDEFVTVTFYTNSTTFMSTYMYSSTVQGYTIW